tara:strand:+ start:476 stop:1249 length:774 start_codon:yes stop_codon:yes gene_type:complete
MTTFDNTIPLKPSEFSPEFHVPYNKIHSHPNGGKKIFAKAKIKAPVMRLAFDANVNEDENGRKKYDFSLSFLGSDTDSKIEEFKNKCDELDNYNIDWATKNSMELWGEDLTAKRVIVEDRYTPIVKIPKKPEYSPTIKIKLMTNYDTGKNEFQVFSNVKNENKEFPELSIWSEEDGLDLSVFKQKTTMATLIEYMGMWIIGKKIYPQWRLVQCQSKSGASSEKKFALADSDDEEEEESPTEVQDKVEDSRPFDDEDE